jgi:hypothetical protein
MIRRLVLSMVISTALFVAGCKARPAGKPETGIMTRAKHLIFVRNKNEKNPLLTTADNVAAGKEVFSKAMTRCGLRCSSSATFRRWTALESRRYMTNSRTQDLWERPPIRWVDTEADSG